MYYINQEILEMFLSFLIQKL